MKGPELGKSDVFNLSVWDTTETELLLWSQASAVWLSLRKKDFSKHRGLTIQSSLHGENVYCDYIFINNIVFKPFSVKCNSIKSTNDHPEIDKLATVRLKSQYGIEISCRYFVRILPFHIKRDIYTVQNFVQNQESRKN